MISLRFLTFYILSEWNFLYSTIKITVFFFKLQDCLQLCMFSNKEQQPKRIFLHFFPLRLHIKFYALL